jgi:hypothetical protein
MQRHLALRDAFRTCTDKHGDKVVYSRQSFWKSAPLLGSTSVRISTDRIESLDRGNEKRPTLAATNLPDRSQVSPTKQIELSQSKGAESGETDFRLHPHQADALPGEKKDPGGEMR